MTYEEAINLLREIRRDSYRTDYAQAIDKAILGLEKQILREPISIGDGHKDHGTCPCCGCLIDEAYNRYVCHTCGQAIDWSGIDER